MHDDKHDDKHEFINTWLRFLAIHMFILNCEYVSIME